MRKEKWKKIIRYQLFGINGAFLNCLIPHVCRRTLTKAVLYHWAIWYAYELHYLAYFQSPLSQQHIVSGAATSIGHSERPGSVVVIRPQRNSITIFSPLKVLMQITHSVCQATPWLKGGFFLRNYLFPCSPKFTRWSGFNNLQLMSGYWWELFNFWSLKS